MEKGPQGLYMRPGEVFPSAGADYPSTGRRLAPRSPLSPRRRRIRNVIGGTVVAALLALLGYFVSPRPSSGDDPLEAAGALLRAYAAGDEDKVDALSCERTDWRTWEFTEWVGTAPPQPVTGMSWTLGVGQRQNNAPVQNSLGVPVAVTAPSQSASRTHTFTMSLQQEDSQWRVCDIR